MLGYVTADKPELKIREYDIYKGYYCGICKSIGGRYGQLPRMALSYDAAFLALLLASLEEGEDKPSREHCIIHPVRKNPVLHDAAIDYAADVMLALAWFKLLDDVSDEKKITAAAALPAFYLPIRKIRKSRPELFGMIKGNLQILHGLEQGKCDSLDQVSDAFARILGDVLAMGPHSGGQEVKDLLSRLGYHLGKWIYLMDAWEDVEENIKSGAYNPLLLRYGYGEGESSEAFRERIRPACRWNLFICCEEIGKAADALAIKKNRGIIENIVYFGLHRKTEAALGKEEQQNGESL